jgi:hypothetical protein
VKRRQSNS